MTMVHWLLGAALAAQASAPIPVFPCEKLDPGFLEIYDGFEAAAAPAPARVEVRKKAVLFDRALALSVRTFTLSDPSRANGKALVFRPYRDGGAQIICTQMRSDALFGVGDETSQYALRCLADRDGDGRFDGFRRRIGMVQFRSDKPIPRTPGPPDSEFLPFAQPLALVERPRLADSNRSFWPRARNQISVFRTKGDSVELRFAGLLDNLPDHAPHWAGRHMDAAAAVTIVAVPMTEGAVVPILGTRIQFSRAKGKWTATVLDGYGSEPKLLCSGSVVQVGDSFTIMSAGGIQSTFSRASLVPR